MKCPFCDGKAEKVEAVYHGQNGIQFPAYYMKCKDTECGHSWLPTEEEQRIEKELLKSLQR